MKTRKRANRMKNRMKFKTRCRKTIKKKRKRKFVNCKKRPKDMICVKGTKKKMKLISKYAKKLNMKLTKCSRNRLMKNKSKRRKRST